MFKRLLIGLSVLALIVSAVWASAAFWFKWRLEAWADDLRARGYVIATSEPLLIGFPFAAGVMVQTLEIAAPESHGGWRWHSGPVNARLAITAPTAPRVDLTGAHRITGLFAPSESGFDAQVHEGHLRLSFTRNGVLDATHLRLTGAQFTPIGASAPLVTVAQADVATTHTNALHVTVGVRGLTVPTALPDLSPTLDALDLTADLVGTIPGGPLRPALEHWRADGGALDIRNLSLVWAMVGAGGNGTLALDERLQPIGAFTVKFQGFFDLVAALTAKGLVEERDASLAKIVLGMLARPGPSGQPELSLPLTLQDRKLYAGPVMLMTMPETTWRSNARIPN